MLQHESYHHLNEKEADTIRETETDNTNSKKDGSTIHIPFRVHYSNHVLLEDQGLNTEHRE